MDTFFHSGSAVGFVLIFLAMLTLVGVGIYFGHLAEKKRRQEMAALAQQLGWTFDPRKNGAFDSQYSQFGVFNQGHSRFAYNTMHGDVEIDARRWQVSAGDYHYRITSGSGKNRSTRTYQFSYMIFHLPYLTVPDLKIRQEGVFDKLTAMLGWDDIDFESAEFSNRFHVTSSDKRFAYDVVDPRMMSFLLDSSPPSVELGSNCCCLFDGKQCWTPDEFRRMLRWASEFFDRWPDHVTASLDQPEGRSWKV